MVYRHKISDADRLKRVLAPNRLLGLAKPFYY